MKLLVATGNAGKLKEISALLDPEGVEVIGLKDLEEKFEIVEDGDTFEDNAKKKARTLHEATGLPVLADDSGLMVAALDGEPGVHSARYAGADATDEENNSKLLEKMGGVEEGERGAAFICVMALIDGDENETIAEGRFGGRISDAPAGAGGFGYDPVFIPEGYHQTLAELSPEVKNRISHRAKALRVILPVIVSLRG